MSGALLACAIAALLSAAPAFADDATVLSPDDAQRYRQIFADERNGDFAAAQDLVSQLSDHSLVGYAQAEHYLSAHSSHTTIEELVSWLNQYGDLAIADRIYALAVNRASKPIKKHHRIVGYKVTVEVPTPAAAPRARGGGYEDTFNGDSSISSDAGRAALSQIETDVRADQPAEADTVLQAVVAANSAPGSDTARLSQRVAASYLAEGQDFNAFDVASRPAGIDRASAPLLDWDAGFAAYRMGKFDVAAAHFETLAQVGSVPNYVRSQAAFWAARAHLANGDPLHAVTLLVAASREEPTFYGLLAERILGQDSEAGFSDPVVNADDFAALMQIAPAHRAMALWQTGETAWLHEEMARAMADMDLRQDETFAALARRMNLPDLELRASETAASRGRMLTGLFPVPGYAPPGGYHVDPSLVLAFVRIESKFQPSAVSHAGARGLMQIMPGTAAHLEGGAPSTSQLDDPSYNLGLGQKYLDELLDDLSGNLFEIAAAYNAGPGSLTRWLGRSDKHDDPLLFIESVPVPETRDYVKRLMTYYWMYSRRTGEHASTLDETAKGGWPLYRHEPALAQPAPATPPPTPVVVSDASY
jgi:soluble lytic murein transglycosylase-like protein